MAKKGPFVLLVICLFLLLPCAYGSQIGVTWTGTAGDNAWATPTNWSSSSVPNNGGGTTYTVSIGPPGATIDLLGGFTIDGLAMNSANLGIAGGPNSLTLATGPSSLTNSQILGGTFTTNGTLTLANGTINASLTNNGTINAVSGLNTFAGTVLNNAGASINVNSGAALQLETGGTYTNNGTINLAGATLLLDATGNGASGNTVTLAGSGSLTLSNSGGNMITEASGNSGLTLVNGAGHTIQGAGEIGGDPTFTLNNQGTMNANQPAGIQIAAGSIVNSGLMEATAGSVLEIASVPGVTFTNNGTVNVAASSMFTVGNATKFTNYQNQTLTGGTYDIAGGFLFAGADIVTNQATLSLSGDGAVVDALSDQNGLRDFSDNGAQGQFSLLDDATLQTGGDFTNQGAVDISAGSLFAVGPTGTGTSSQTGGSTVLDGTLKAGTVVLDGGDLSGTGTLIGNLENDANVDPGDDPGTLTINGSYTQDSGGVLNIGIESGSIFDVLAISGNAQLDGTLNLTMLSGFRPQYLEEFTIMTFSSSSGDFANLTSNADGGWEEIRTADSLGVEFVAPEPSTWVLFAAGLAGFACFKRRAIARR